MSTRPERPAPGPATHPGEPTSAAPSPSIPLPDSVPRPHASAANALSECFGAICLVQVTLHSLESQDVGCPEQEVLTRALRTLWSVHDWINDRMWSDTEAERAQGRECQP
jgi:hypothetical protein